MSGRVTRSRTSAGTAAPGSSHRAPLTVKSTSTASTPNRRRRKAANNGRTVSNYLDREDETGSTDVENSGHDDESETNSGIDDNGERKKDEEVLSDNEDGEAGEASAENEERGMEAEGGHKERELVGNPGDGEGESNMAAMTGRQIETALWKMANVRQRRPATASTEN